MEQLNRGNLFTKYLWEAIKAIAIIHNSIISNVDISYHILSNC